MESFFEREVQRIEFVNKRNQIREAQKKSLDQTKIEKQQVLSGVFYGGPLSGKPQICKNNV